MQKGVFAQKISSGRMVGNQLLTPRLFCSQEFFYCNNRSNEKPNELVKNEWGRKRPFLFQTFFADFNRCPFWITDAHSLKIQGEGPWGFCQILGGRVYRGCEYFGGRVHLFGVLLHFYEQGLQNFWREGTLLSPLSRPHPHCVHLCFECSFLAEFLLFLYS